MPVTSPEYSEVTLTPHKGGHNDKLSHFEPIWSILPSYDMHASTMHKPLNPDADNRTLPGYDNISSHTEAPSQQPIVADDNVRWQKTILGNIDKLQEFSSENKAAVSVEIQFTDSVARVGEPLTPTDISCKEYKPGDYINGYIIIENSSGVPVPFDAFYVIFEGVLTVGSDTTAVDDPTKDKDVVYTSKFLEMLDFSASWQPEYVTRLISEERAPESHIDALDNTSLSFGTERLISTTCRHKRFFTFKIPERLLDSACQHNLHQHTELPSSLGVTKREKLYHLKHRKSADKIRDFSFIDTSIKYSIGAYFIGRASMYGAPPKPWQRIATSVVNATGDEFVNRAHSKRHVRVVHHSPTSGAPGSSLSGTILHRNLLSRLDQHIKLAEALGNPKERSQSTPSVELASAHASHPTSMKRVQSVDISMTPHPKKSPYWPLPEWSETTTTPTDTPSRAQYTVIFPVQKRSITGKLQQLGTLVALSPKRAHRIQYIPPHYSRPVEDSSWILKIPIALRFHPSTADVKSTQPLQIKRVGVELVTQTVRAGDGAIPIEITTDSLFETIKIEKTFRSALQYSSDHVDEVIVQPVRKKYRQLLRMAHQLGPETLQIDAPLARDVEALCSLESKNNTMIVKDIKVCDGKDGVAPATVLSQLPWSRESDVLVKDFALKVNLATAELKSPQAQAGKAYDNFCLVPSFQNCYMLRYYYVRVSLTLQNNEVLVVNVPFEVKS
ncbi:Bul1 N-terminal domain-containing protein [[Candida] zeylanoides]